MQWGRQAFFVFSSALLLFAGLAFSGPEGSSSAEVTGHDLPQTASAAELDLQNLLAEMVSATPLSLQDGGWEFPESQWQMSSREVQGPTCVRDLGPLAELKAEADPLDSQLLYLLEQLQPVIRPAGELQVCEITTAFLRGYAVIRSTDQHQIVLRMCLSWPAEGDLWNELRLERRGHAEIVGLLPELPEGGERRAVRRLADGSVDCDVIEIAQSRQQLLSWLGERDWQIVAPAELPSVLWISRAGVTVEVTAQQVREGDGQLLVMRQLSRQID